MEKQQALSELYCWEKLRCIIQKNDRSSFTQGKTWGGKSVATSVGPMLLFMLEMRGKGQLISYITIQGWEITLKYILFVKFGD